MSVLKSESFNEINMEYIRVTKENLEQEHICCAISNNKDVQVSSKKAWLAERFDEGLVFLKSVERGKCFIEYIPADYKLNYIIAIGYPDEQPEATPRDASKVKYIK